MVIAIGTSPNPLIRNTTEGVDTNRHGCIITSCEDGLTSRTGGRESGPEVYAVSGTGMHLPDR